jgi:hypothetical protein
MWLARLHKVSDGGFSFWQKKRFHNFQRYLGQSETSEDARQRVLAGKRAGQRHPAYF